jgi:hypothetical protein
VPNDPTRIDQSRETLFGRLAAAIPAFLLIVVASNQIYLAHTRDLDPWKGGGFGMFATSPTRHSHVFVIEPGGEQEVDLPEDLEDLEDRLRALPSDDRFREFARELTEALRAEHPDQTAVRVEVWSTHYDVEDLTPEALLIRDFESEAPHRGTR